MQILCTAYINKVLDYFDTPNSGMKIKFYQISTDNGWRKAKKPLDAWLGFLYKMDIPRLRNGLVKSITFYLIIKKFKYIFLVTIISLIKNRYFLVL